MNLPSLKDLNLQGKRIVVRFDGDVPFGPDGISDRFRLEAVEETVRYCLEAGATIVLIAHRGRPKGKQDPALSNKPLADYFSQVLHEPVAVVESLLEPVNTAGRMSMLENLRFHAGEEANDVSFARLIAKFGDYYCNDAFAVSHRAHASVAALPGLMPHVAGIHFLKEIEALSPLLNEPDKPYTVVLGGAKASDKSPIIADLIGRVDNLVIGGLVAITYLAAMGCPVGAHPIEPEQVSLAQECIRRFHESNITFELPVDIVTQNREVKPVTDWAKDDMMLDIGPETQKRFADIICRANSVFWNGAMGKFEDAAFAAGTLAVARAIAQSDADIRIASGGDTANAIQQFDLKNGFSHISTGGGATLEYIAGRELPGIQALLVPNPPVS